MNHSNKNANTDLRQIEMDIVINAVALVASLALCTFFGSPSSILPLAIIGGVFTTIFMFVCKAAYLYNITLFYYKDRVFRKVFGAYILATLISLALLLFASSVPKADRCWFYCFLIIDAVSFADKILLYRNGKMRNSAGSTPRVLYVGKIERFEKFKTFIDKTNIKHQLVGYVSMSEHRFHEEEGYIGWLGELENLIRENHIDQVYIMQRHGDQVEFSQNYIDMCVTMGVTVKLVMDLYDGGGAYSYVSSVGTYPVITYHRISFNVTDKMLKRIMDFIFAFFAIIISSPIMLVTAIAIKIDSPGPILFKQTRVGQNGRHFKILKFRSMYKDAEARKAALMAQNEIEGGVMFKMKDDPRITRVGKFIRKTSIDELPQFFNILVGQMSMVGTRPPTLDEVEKYKMDQWRRISIKPGLTGMWQVSGRSNIDNFDEIVRLDTEYIDKWSIGLDIKILFKTVLVVLKHEGSC
ncbi:MAG: sugar transferase [Lachnospiraceae bacterium]|nr:sugar transferase [Lachnospiraceae bacterium]